MFRRIFANSGLTPLALMVSFLAAGSTAAQNEGYSVWLHRNDGGGGWGSGGYYSRRQPVYYYSAPAYTYGALADGYQALYPPPSDGYYPDTSTTGPAKGGVLISVSVPADAEIWFDGSKTMQTGTIRRFVSPSIVPGYDYAYDVTAKWKENGREVTQSRRVVVHAGERVSIIFPQMAPTSVKR
jgi:uncharacterized protein (TIGR03000 family)